MDNISKNPGLQHIIEEIFFNLNSIEDVMIHLENCQKVCKSWMLVLTNPWFWLRSCVKNQKLQRSKSFKN